STATLGAEHARPLVIQAKCLSQEPAAETRECRVIAMKRLNHHVLELRLKPGQRLHYCPGQYIEVLMADGRLRPFSIANAPHVSEVLELHVRFYPNGLFSRFAFTDLREGEVLRIRGPYGQVRLREETDRPAIFIAGGTGFAPIKSLIEQALRRGTEQPLYLYWGARASQDLYMDELPKAWSGTYPWLRYVPVLSNPATSDHWRGRTGLVHEAVLQDFSQVSSYQVYTAGPPLMVQAVQESLLARGLKKGCFFSETFEPASE
ncbi:MAG: NAD(P)H-flavin reductase, partial [Gammaproteobacteria bacterium]